MKQIFLCCQGKIILIQESFSPHKIAKYFNLTNHWLLPSVCWMQCELKMGQKWWTFFVSEKSFWYFSNVPDFKTLFSHLNLLTSFNLLALDWFKHSKILQYIKTWFNFKALPTFRSKYAFLCKPNQLDWFHKILKYTNIQFTLKVQVHLFIHQMITLVNYWNTSWLDSTSKLTFKFCCTWGK